jgi:hypothetical protein
LQSTDDLVAFLNLTGSREGPQVHQSVALTRDTLVEFDDHLGHRRSSTPHRDDGIGHLVECVQILEAERMADTLFREQSAAAGLRAEADQPGISSVHRDAQGDGDVSLELRGVVGDEVRPGWVGDE